MYVTIITCSDIAFAVSQLAHFLMNSESLHQVITDQTLLYLKRYQNLSLQLSKNNEYIITSNVLFVNNIVNCKSSQNYAIKLFRNLVK